MMKAISRQTGGRMLPRIALAGFALASLVTPSLAGAEESSAAASDISPEQRQAIEAIIGDYIANHPEGVVNALRAYQAQVQKEEQQQAEAALQQSRIALGYARISSPISGRIGRSAVTEGALVTANQAEPLTTVQTLDPIHIDLSMSASELLALRQELERGNLHRVDDVPVTILLDNGTVYPHEGRVAFTDVTVDPSTGSVLLRVTAPNPDFLLLPGMYVRARVSLAQRQQAILAPQQGIMRDPKGNASALVVSAANRVEQRQVEVSRTIGDRWLVEQGLAAGDRVIVEGLQKVQPDALVEPIEQQLAGTADSPSPDPTAPGNETTTMADSK